MAKKFPGNAFIKSGDIKAATTMFSIATHLTTDSGGRQRFNPGIIGRELLRLQALRYYSVLLNSGVAISSVPIPKTNKNSRSY